MGREDLPAHRHLGRIEIDVRNRNQHDRHCFLLSPVHRTTGPPAGTGRSPATVRGGPAAGQRDGVGGEPDACIRPRWFKIRIVGNSETKQRRGGRRAPTRPRRPGPVLPHPRLDHDRHRPAERARERLKGIEPSSSAWKAEALPLSYSRIDNLLFELDIYCGSASEAACTALVQRISLIPQMSCPELAARLFEPGKGPTLDSRIVESVGDLAVPIPSFWSSPEGGRQGTEDPGNPGRTSIRDRMTSHGEVGVRPGRGVPHQTGAHLVRRPVTPRDEVGRCVPQAG